MVFKTSMGSENKTVISKKETGDEYMIFPIPIKEEYYDQFYCLKETKWDHDLYRFYKKTSRGNKDISLEECKDLKDEEYELHIIEQGISIKYSTEIGKFRALTSLRQLIKGNDVVKCCQIKDFPQFERRGYMLDISRGRVPKVETITWLIDLLADLKYNELQLYMHNHCYKYSAFPEYTKNFDCLTAEDIEYLDKYCSDRFIELVPNQNSLGHMEEWLDLPEFSHLGLTDGTVPAGTLNPLLDETIEFIDKLYSSLLPHFESKYVNIGLDEAFGLGRFQTEEVCNKYGVGNVFVDYLEKITELCEKKYGKTVMFWSDMVRGYPECLDRIPKQNIALNWAYDLIPTQMIEKRCIDLVKAGIPFYVCPGTCTWLSFTGRFDTMNFNLRTMGEVGREYGAKGYLLTDWSSGGSGHPHFMVWSLVPCALGGQFAWNVGEKQNGGRLKKQFTYAAENYINETIFDGVKIAHLLRRMQRYYLLEPERMHNATLCGAMFSRRPLTDCTSFVDFESTECEDNFYFDNVIEYMKKNLADLEEAAIDERWKREIKVNADMVIVATELMKVRISQKVSSQMYDYLCAYMDRITEEYRELWCYRNYENGVERFINQLTLRKEELGCLKEV